MIFGINDTFKLFLRNICEDKNRHGCYQQCCDHAEEMSIHLYGINPSKILNAARPREDAETKQYRIDAYQPTTVSTSDKALSILAKIWNPSLYSIKWRDPGTDGKTLENYTMKEYPMFNSVVNLMSDSVMKKMLADPNGVIAIRPRTLDIPQEKRPEAIAKVYGSPSIWYYDDYMYLIFLRKDKITQQSPQGKLVNETYYFEYYDNKVVIEFSVAFPNAQETEIDVIDNYEHGCGDIPVWTLGGVPDLMDNGVILYKSFFNGALPHWNLAIMHESDLFGAYINHLHPLRTELAEECDYKEANQKCQNGFLPTVNANGDVIGNITCPSCHGTGHRSVKSPYGVYLYNKEKLEGNTTGLSPVEYVNIPTDATKMLEARVDKMHEKGLNALNMDIVNKVGENQSGVAKVIDRSELYDFMGKIASQLFDVHLTNIFYFFNKQMFGVSTASKPNDPTVPDPLDRNLPEINKPVNFDMSSAQDLLDKITASRNAEVNPEVSKSLQKELISKEFTANTDDVRRLNLILDLDPLGNFSVSDLVAAESLQPKPWTPESIVMHLNMGHFVDRAVHDNKGFIDMDKDQQLIILEGYAKEILAKNKVTLDTAAINPTQQNQQQNNAA